MSKWAPVLQRHLENLVRLNERLLKSLEARKEAMTGRDAARMQALMAEEARILHEVSSEEKRRQVTMLRLGEEFGCTPAQMSQMQLSEAARLLGEPWTSQLLDLRQRLRGVAGRSRELNTVLTGLAQRMLPHFHELLEILLTGTPGRQAYNAGGRAVRTTGEISVLDMRA